MWATSQGDRTLIGHQGSLVLGAIGYLRDMITVGVEIDEPHQTGVAIFDALQPTQQLAILHQVAFGLLDNQTPMPQLNSVREATVYVLFRELRSLVEIELDMSRIAGPPHHEVRLAILKAYQEGSKELPEWGEASEFQGKLSDPVTDEQPLTADVVEIDRWFEILETLADQILWDRDFELEEVFADQDPERVESVKHVMGINEDYFRVPAPDAFSDEYLRLDRDLIALTSARRPIFQTQPGSPPLDHDSEIEY